MGAEYDDPPGHEGRALEHGCARLGARSCGSCDRGLDLGR
jgi:hypothetical protein